MVIDANLQDPPEWIPSLLEGWREGYVVYATRTAREGETAFQRGAPPAARRREQRGLGRASHSPNTTATSRR